MALNGRKKGRLMAANYFPFLPLACASALPAIDLAVLLYRPSLRTLEALDATFLLVTFFSLGVFFLANSLPSFPLTKFDNTCPFSFSKVIIPYP